MSGKSDAIISLNTLEIFFTIKELPHAIGC